MNGDVTKCHTYAFNGVHSIRTSIGWFYII
jgi:hypothetical protein